ncbi:MAG: hypothetical protein SGI92_08180 [Bryobacteraceae bacterium]|nr:hypothetical protein [Bryobacteraceae bacterium]
MITVVSGLARSGTSLMMQMLAAGGMPVLTDGQRVPDEDNPRGYCEWEPVKLLAEQPAHIDEAEGKAVKVISSLLTALPEGREYRIILMERPLEEVAASQISTLRRRGTSEVSLDPAEFAATLQSHIDNVFEWLARQSGITTRTFRYHDVLRDPHAIASQVCEFLHAELDITAMAAQADPDLYRRRSPGGATL